MSTFRYRAVDGVINIAANDFSCQTGNITFATYGTLSGTSLTSTTAAITTLTSTTFTTTTANITTAYITTANLTNAAVGILLAGTATVTGLITAGSASITNNLSCNTATIANGLTAQKTTLTKDNPIQSYQPSLTSGQSTTLLLGVANSLNNAAEITFNYTGGPGSPLNSIGLGLVGNENKLTLTPTSFGSSVPFTIPSAIFSPSTIPFKYKEGTWTPTLKYLTASVAPPVLGATSWNITSPQASIVYSVQEGYYVRTGNQVTLYYKIVLVSTDPPDDPHVSGDDQSIRTNIFAIGGLPYTCNKTGGTANLFSSGTCFSEIPNGYAGYIPSGGVTYPPGTSRDMSIYEAGRALTFTYFALTPQPGHTWTSDGLHLIHGGPIKFVLPGIGVGYDAGGFLTNIWYVDAYAPVYVPVPTTLSFDGFITYYTDDVY